MKMTIVASLLLSPFVLAALAGAQVLEKDDEAMRLATSAAQQALATFGRLANEQNYRSLGFDSLDQVRQARLGTPVRGFMIRLDELREYDGGAPGRLLHETDQITFPVEVGGRTRSGLTVVLRQGRWETESFGAPGYVRLLDEARTRLAERTGQPEAEPFEVQVPALAVRFVGVRSDGALLLASIVDDPRFGFERGVAIPAEEAMAKLVPAARQHNGLPI